jgi:hypothetical protein
LDFRVDGITTYASDNLVIGEMEEMESKEECGWFYRGET